MGERAPRDAIGVGLVGVGLVAVLALGGAAPTVHAATRTGGPVAASLPAAGSAVVAQEDGPSLPDPEVEPGEARDEADRILAGDEYREPEPTVMERVLQWIIDRIEDLLRRLSFSSGPAGSGASSVVAWLLLLALVGGVGWLIYRNRASFRGRARGEEDDPIQLTEIEARRSATEWLANAARFESEGEWKQGLRCRFRALIADLIDHGVVRDLAGRTSGEFRIEVRRQAPAIAEPFRAASGLFDAAFYGDEPTGADEAGRFRDLVAMIELELERVRHDREADRREPVDAFVAPGSAT